MKGTPGKFQPSFERQREIDLVVNVTELQPGRLDPRQYRLIFFRGGEALGHYDFDHSSLVQLALKIVERVSEEAK